MPAPRRLKQKLMTAILLTSGTVVLLGCGTFLVDELLMFRRTMVRNVSTLAQVIAVNSTAALAFDNSADATSVLLALAADPHIEAAGLYDHTGELFARYPPTAPDASLPEHPGDDGYRFTRTELLLVQPVTNANRRLGTVFVKSDLGLLYQRLTVFGALIAWVLVASGVTAFVLSERLQRSISQPVLALVGTAKTVAEDRNYSVRAEKFDQDELGQLTDAFNGMLAQVEARDRSLRQSEETLRREVTERTRVEDEVRRLNAELETRVRQRTVELEEANKELESFSYSVSHDLRAPLRHVHGYVELLTRATDGQLSEKAQRYLKTILDASADMGHLIDDLLAFSKMGRVEMRESRVRLDDLLRETIRGLEMTTSGRRIEWQVAPLPAIVGDPSMLKQVFVNLVGNAVKYTRLRDQARIEVGCAGEEDGRAVLFVRDNGAGFDMQYAHKLFGVFQRLHRSEDFEGTGIGLAIVRRIIARHGGRVWAEGAVDNGATFYFTLQPAPQT